MTAVLIGERRGRFETQKYKKEGHVKTEAGIGEMLPQAKRHQEPPDARRSEEGFFLQPLEGGDPVDT